MRIAKLVGIVLGAIVAVFVIALLAVRLLVDPNDYKERIVRAVRESTGRDLALPGTIKLSVFPSIALDLGPASLGNLPGFGDEPFASVQHAALQVRVLPLLHKRLEVGHVAVDGLDLRLQKNAAGQGNWEQPKSGNPTPESSPGTSGTPGTLPDVAGIEVSNSRISYQDMVLDHVSLNVGRLANAAQVPVKVNFDLSTGPGGRTIVVAGQFALTLDTLAKRYQLAAMTLQGTISSGQGAAPVSWKLAASKLDVDLGAQTLGVQNLAAQFGAAKLTMDLTGSKVIDAPSISGSFRLDPVSPRELMSQLAITPPVTRDPKVLAKLAASGGFNYGSNQLALSKLDAQLDDSHLSGSAGITDLTAKAIGFDLTLDQIDVDRYRSPASTKPQPAPAPTAAQNKSSGDVLKSLQMDGTFTVGLASVAGLHVSDVQLALKAKDGVTNLAPVTAKLYGGQYAGSITLDDRGPVLASKLEQTLTAVDVAQLLKDFAKSQRLAGKGTITTSLTARGSGGDEVLKSLNGHVALNLDNGAVEGMDLWYEINRAMALVQKQAAPAGASSGRTSFDSFKASADIVNGVATTKDLLIASQNLKITGQGSTNLVTEAINYDVKASVLQGAPGATKAGAASLADIPLAVGGTMSSPAVRVDLQALLKSQLQQQLNQHKDQIKQQLQNKLQDLLK